MEISHLKLFEYFYTIGVYISSFANIKMLINIKSIKYLNNNKFITSHAQETEGGDAD